MSLRSLARQRDEVRAATLAVGLALEDEQTFVGRNDIALLETIICEDPFGGPALLFGSRRDFGYEVFPSLQCGLPRFPTSFPNVGDPLLAAYFRLRGHVTRHSLTEGGAARRHHQDQTEEERIGSPGPAQLDGDM